MKAFPKLVATVDLERLKKNPTKTKQPFRFRCGVIPVIVQMGKLLVISTGRSSTCSRAFSGSSTNKQVHTKASFHIERVV